MASFYGDNATKRDVSEPSTKIDSQDQHGRLRVAYDSFDLAAVIGTSDILYMQKLPAGAKVYEVEVNSDDLGTTGVLDIGWGASAEGGEAADADGFYASLDVKTAAVARQKYANTVAGFQKKFTEEVTIQISASEATSASSGNINLAIFYSVD